MQTLFLTKQQYTTTTGFAGNPISPHWVIYYKLNEPFKEMDKWGWWSLICEYQAKTKKLWIMPDRGEISSVENLHIIREIENLYGNHDVYCDIDLKSEKEFEEMSDLLLDTLLNVLNIERVNVTRCIKHDY